MYKILRITFCILTVAIAAVAIFIFVYKGWLWGLASLVLAVVFGALMVLFKQLQEKQERKENPPPTAGDFITGKVKPEENSDNGREEK